ncbi:MAG: hypothetical protein ACOC0U_04985 [Desulfovibrionales bacterium]
MKVFNSGSNSGSFGRHGHESHRAREFRARHSVGERLQGTVLTSPEHGRAWIDIQGSRLLAILRTTAFPGQELLFLITQLVPKIILKEITPEGSMGSLQDLVGKFSKERSRFEDLFAQCGSRLHDLPKRCPARKESFLKLVANDTSALPVYLSLKQTEQVINQILEPAGRSFHYLPWLFPDVCRSEAILLRQAEQMSSKGEPCTELTALFLHPVVGPVRLHSLIQKRALLSRLFLQDLAHAEKMEQWIREWEFPSIALTNRLVGVFQIGESTTSLLEEYIPVFDRSGINLTV